MAAGILAATADLANYTGAFEAAPFARFFANVGLAVVCTLFVILTSLVAGAVFAKYRFPAA